eukprot:2867784-Rhodomonas_salina.1
MMAPCATSASPSCESLLSMSMTVGFGFDMCSIPTASGTTLLAPRHTHEERGGERESEGRASQKREDSG